MKLLWKDTEIYSESCMFAIERKSELLFDATEIIKIETPATGKVYKINHDFTFTPGTNIIELTDDTQIPYIPREICYPENDARFHPEKSARAIRNAVNGGNLLFNNENFFALNQVEVTYRAVKNDFESGLEKQKERLPRVRAKLRASDTLKIVLHGDSISEGYNSGKFTNTPPYLPCYMEQVCNELPGEHKFINRAVGGKGIKFPRTIFEEWIGDQPDLMVIAYGMNNFSSMPPEDFIGELNWMIEENRKVSPATEYIIVTPMTGNPEWKPTVPGPDLKYAQAMRDYVKKSDLTIALADVQKVWRKILGRKKFYDLSGNGVNHPNDYGHRIYASALLDLLTP